MALELNVGVVAAPMAGGASTPELAAAAGEAGGLGFLAAGYRTAEAMGEQIAGLRAVSARPFGVNLFVPGPDTAEEAAVAAYRERIAPEAERLGVEPGEARWRYDDYPAKIAALIAEPVPVVSFTFGLPHARDVAALHRQGSLLLATVTTPGEARAAAEAGMDALCVQGAEAGGHQGSFDDTTERTRPLLELLAAVRADVDLPLVAAGGIAHADGVRRVREAGAVAARERPRLQPGREQWIGERPRESSFPISSEPSSSSRVSGRSELRGWPRRRDGSGSRIR
jgi:nitronate monooxygenase